MDERIAQWERRRVISEVWNHWFQVAALLVAGIWVTVTFGLQFLPGREKQFVAERTLVWSPGPTPNTCAAKWYLAVKNISAGSIDVRRVELRVWRYQMPKPSSKTLDYIDPDVFRPRKNQPFLFERRFVDGDDALIDRYAPNGLSEADFQWVFKRPVTREWVTMEVELYEGIDGTGSLWFASESSEVCPAESRQFGSRNSGG